MIQNPFEYIQTFSLEKNDGHVAISRQESAMICEITSFESIAMNCLSIYSSDVNLTKKFVSTICYTVLEF